MPKKQKKKRRSYKKTLSTKTYQRFIRQNKRNACPRKIQRNCRVELNRKYCKCVKRVRKSLSPKRKAPNILSVQPLCTNNGALFHPKTKTRTVKYIKGISHLIKYNGVTRSCIREISQWNENNGLDTDCHCFTNETTVKSQWKISERIQICEFQTNEKTPETLSRFNLTHGYV